MSFRAFFGSQRGRLLRDDWGRLQAKGLAEELYAFMGSEGPIPLDRPLIFQYAGDQPPIQVIYTPGLNGTPTPTAISIQRAPLPDTVFNLGQPGQQGNVPVQQQDRDSGGTPATTVFLGVVTGAGGGSNAVPLAMQGLIDGTQKQYSVTLNSGSVVNATQAQQAASATIPNGTAVMVLKLSTGYVIVNPVWLSS